jgi:hypothetical protein
MVLGLTKWLEREIAKTRTYKYEPRGMRDSPVGKRKEGKEEGTVRIQGNKG